MRKKVVLPINKEPYIHSNTSRTSLFAVLTSEAYAGRINAVISRLCLTSKEKKQNGLCKGDFQKHLENMEMEIDQSTKTLKFQSHPYTEKKNAYVYQNLEGNQSFSVEATIHYIQNSNASSYVKLVLSKGRKERKENLQEWEFAEECSLSLYPDGKIVFRLHNQKIERRLNGENGKSAVTFRFEFKKDEYFVVQYSYDHKRWTEVFRTKQLLHSFEEAGLYVSPKICPFFYDFYTSHIQLCYTWDNKIIAPHFDSYERYFSKMLPAMQMPMCMLNLSNKKVIDFIMELISRNYYINMGVDEFYIPGRIDYRKRHHMHVNFLYGFDREKKVFLLLGFDRFMKFSEIDFDSFFQAIQRKPDKNAKINLYRYVSRDYPKTLSVDAVIYLLKAYLEGKNSFAISSSEVIVEDSNKPILYGLKIHETICRENSHMSRFLRDIRIIYQIYEHNLIMKEMVIFLHHIQLLTEVFYEEIIVKFEEAAYFSSTIKNVVLKNRIAPQKDIEVKIRGMLEELMKKEEEAIEALILKLEINREDS